MRKIISILLAFSLLICLAAGCGASGDGTDPASEAPATTQQGQPGSTAANVPETEPEQIAEILDKDGKLLARIDGRANASAADAGIFYSIFVQGEYEFTATAQYRFYRLSDGKDILLGTLEDQGYEAVYARTEMDGTVYALALTGNPFDSAPDALWLLAFDPLRETMNKVRVSENASPYAAMTAADGKVLVMVHELCSPKRDKVFEFDAASGTLKEVLSFSSEGSRCESLRGVYAEGEKLYLLRLAVEGGNTEELYLDVYDGAYGKLTERPLRELIFSEEYAGIVSPGDEKAELGMIASGFAVREGRYLYYENFGVTRALVDLETGKNLFARDDSYALSIGGGKKVFYFFDLGQAEPGQAVQGVYDLKNGTVERTVMTPPDGRTMIRSVSVSPNGTWLLRFSDSEPRVPGMDALVIRTEP